MTKPDNANDFYKDSKFSMKNTLMYFNDIQECFLKIVDDKELLKDNLIQYFDTSSDTYADFLESMSYKYKWFDYRMVPNITELINILIDDELDKPSSDTDIYMEWYQELEQEMLNTFNIELSELLELVRHRINIDHFFDKGKTPQHSVHLIGVYYREEIEVLKMKKGGL